LRFGYEKAKKKQLAVILAIVRTWGAAVLRPYFFVAGSRVVI
jgi:hypothetical protein